MPLLLRAMPRLLLTPLLPPVTWLLQMLPKPLLTLPPWLPTLLIRPLRLKPLPVQICPRLTTLPTLLKMQPTPLVRPRILLKKLLLLPSSNIALAVTAGSIFVPNELAVGIPTAFS